MALLNARSVANKSFILNDLITTRNLDFMFITETWQKSEEYVFMNELCPPGCSFTCAPRTTGRGGGLAVFHKDSFSCRRVCCGSFISFELLVTKIGRSNPFYCVLIYRPPGVNGQFLSEFSDFLASIIKFEKILLLGDFNMAMNDSTSHIAANFLEVTESFNFCQHVSGPTHVRGNTLDLVFTLGLMIDSVASEELPVTDHDCILFNVF